MIKNVVELRRIFLAYFNSKGHTIVPSSPLVPANDPTLLFTNAGMVQFKETFLGIDQRDYQRAASCQRCVRAGGKHNDLENVGYTARHHTFFEMLGNFSFGEYFKREAIEFAWEFLTQILQIPTEKLWVTVYEEDDEAADIWLKHIQVDPARFSRCGKKDNFWMMGETGPCGPCSEIFYDHGNTIVGGPPGSADSEGDRYIEIWNLVFMQYNRDAQGNLTPLPKPSVDTGMGLERLAAVMQGVHSNYDIDLFQHLLKAVAELANCQDLNNNSLRVIADHIRACAFLIVDGIIPSNEGRGYVLRRIIRRAVRHGHKLGLREPFFYKLVNQLDEEMGSAYPELSDSKNIVSQVLKQEEERFADTVHHGLSLLEQNIAIVKNGIISGDVIFKLYDTYGFPADLTADIARERGLTLDMAGFEKNMAAQRALSCAASHFECDFTQVRSIDCQSEFIGYENIDGESCVKLLFYEDKFVENLQKGQSGRVIVEQTPFYAESGGQVGDKGVLIQGNTVFEVQDTQKTGKAFVHSGQVISGEIRVGTQLLLKINVQARQATARNHTATHLLHAALRQILGHHVKQKGSLVEPERLRFDFSHFEPVSDEQLAKIEGLVNAQILRNSPVHTQIMTLDDAMNSGAMALFGEKYAEKVRVLSIADFSTELCGGTHVKHTGDIGLFKIVMETGVAAGVRRIEAMTGYSALEWVAQSNTILNRLAYLLKGDIDSLENRVMQLLQQNKENEKEISRLQSKLVSLQGGDLASQTVEVNGIKVLAARLDNGEVQQLRDMVDQLKNKLGMAAIVLALVKDEKVFLVSGVTENLTNRVKAGDLVNYVAQQVGGKGGGRADMAQAGGKDVSNLATALKSVPTWVKERL